MILFLFVLGLIVGSFLNCVVYRLEKKQSFLKGRSYCPHCKHKLSWKDLIPVLSYILLKGKCRYCKKRISIQYPIVELATGLLFVLLNNPYYIIVFSFLIVIFVYDLKYYIIPDKVIFPAIAIVLIYNIFHIEGLLENLMAGIVPALFFASLFFLSKGKWIGFGDVKLALFMGLFLGLKGVLVALFLAFMFGGIIGLGLIVLNKKNLKSELPFGPFLIAGTFLALLFGDKLINWYLNIL